jgi:tetratricopeptide (TPR) repeat protein
LQVGYIAKAQIQSDEKDTAFVKELYRKGDSYFRTGNKDSALYLYYRCEKSSDSLITKHRNDKITKSWIRQTQSAAIYNIATMELQKGNLAKTEKYILNGIKICDEENFNNLHTSLFILYGNLLKTQGKNDKAQNCFESAIRLSKNTGDKENEMKASNAIAIFYREQGKIEQAIQTNYYALKLAEETQSIRSIPGIYSLLGALHMQQNDYKTAEECFRKGLNQSIVNKEKKTTATARNNLGSLYQKTHQYDKALKEFEAAIVLFKEAKDEKNLAIPLINLGHVQVEMKKYEEARNNFNEGLQLSQKTKDSKTEAATLRNIGTLDYEEKKYSDAEINLTNALILAKKTKYALEIKEINAVLFKVYKMRGKQTEAFESFKTFIKMRDSILNDENSKQLIRQQFKFEYEKKEAMAKAEFEKQEALKATEAEKRKLLLLNKEQKLKLLSNENLLKELQLKNNNALLLQKKSENESKENTILFMNKEQELQRQNNLLKERELEQERKFVIYLAIGFVVILFIFIIVIRAFLILRKSNRIILQQENELNIQKTEIETKQKEILDSIRYAKRIQSSLLPTQIYLTKSILKLKND